jgi:hypothetical protein
VENNTSCACFIPNNLRYTQNMYVYGVSTSTAVARTHLDVTLYVQLVVKCLIMKLLVKYIISTISWRFSALCWSLHLAEGLVDFNFVNNRMASKIICPKDRIFIKLQQEVRNYFFW